MNDELFNENSRTAPNLDARRFATLGALKCENGGQIPEVTVAYQTFGQLNEAKDNAVLICHATSGDSNVVGWWSHLVGPSKPIDTNRFFVVGNNLLGGCQGTTGPSSLHMDGKPWGSRFPRITVGDQIDAQALLLDFLGIEALYCVAGGSVGGGVAAQWTVQKPERVRKCFATGACAAANAMQIGFHETQRQAILRDPNWHGGDYEGEGPDDGLAVARMLGHLTYLSAEMFDKKFSRRRRAGTDRFEVASYLNYQGDGFTKRFDARTYMAFSYAMDEFQLTSLKGSQSDYLWVSFESDWFYRPAQSELLHQMALSAGRPSTHFVSGAPFGHDSFLLDGEEQGEALRAFMR